MRYFNLTLPIPGLAIACMIAFSAETPLSASETDQGLDHSAIQEVLAMAEAGVDEEVILMRLEAISAVPELSGQDIATLKQKGVSKSVLLRLLERGQKLETSHESPLTRPVPAGAVKEERTVAVKEIRDSTPRIRIEVQAKFPIHYAEALIDDRRVATHGELLDGESEPGFFLPQPRGLLRQGSATLFDEAVEPGTYRVAVGVARTEVLSDPNDEWSEYSRQSYATSVVPAAVTEPERLGDEDSRPVCDISPGEICVVTARVIKSRRKRSHPAGAYALEFDTRVVPVQP